MSKWRWTHMRWIPLLCVLAWALGQYALITHSQSSSPTQPPPSATPAPTDTPPPIATSTPTREELERYQLELQIRQLENQGATNLSNSLSTLLSILFGGGLVGGLSLINNAMQHRAQHRVERIRAIHQLVQNLNSEDELKNAAITELILKLDGKQAPEPGDLSGFIGKLFNDKGLKGFLHNLMTYQPSDSSSIDSTRIGAAQIYARTYRKQKEVIELLAAMGRVRPLQLKDRLLAADVILECGGIVEALDTLIGAAEFPRELRNDDMTVGRKLHSIVMTYDNKLDSKYADHVHSSLRDRSHDDNREVYKQVATLGIWHQFDWGSLQPRKYLHEQQDRLLRLLREKRIEDFLYPDAKDPTLERIRELNPPAAEELDERQNRAKIFDVLLFCMRLKIFERHEGGVVGILGEFANDKYKQLVILDYVVHDKNASSPALEENYIRVVLDYAHYSKASLAKRIVAADRFFYRSGTDSGTDRSRLVSKTALLMIAKQVYLHHKYLDLIASHLHRIGCIDESKVVIKLRDFESFNYFETTNELESMIVSNLALISPGINASAYGIEISDDTGTESGGTVESPQP